MSKCSIDVDGGYVYVVEDETNGELLSIGFGYGGGGGGGDEDEYKRKSNGWDFGCGSHCWLMVESL